ncbi:MAG: hypothetical protein WBA76_03090 [Phormidesmis sp.]
MKLPIVGSQAKHQAQPRTQYQAKPQVKLPIKLKPQLQGTRSPSSPSKSSPLKSSPSKSSPSKSSQTKAAQPAGKLQSFSPLKRFASTLAGFKLPEHLSNRPKKGNSTKSASLKTTALSDTYPKGVPTSIIQSATDQSARPKAPAVSNALNASLPFIKESKGSRMALNLLLVRPWVLLIGFWLFSMGVGAIAIEGMVSPKRLKMALPEATTQTTDQTDKDALIKVEQDSEANAAGIAAESAPQDGASQNNAGRPAVGSSRESRSAAKPAANRSGIPVLPLAAMVGTCAAGCLVISRRRAMARMVAARSRGRIRKIGAHASGSKPTETKLEQKSQGKPSSKVATRKISKPKVDRPSEAKPAAVKSSVRAAIARPAAVRSKKRRPRNKRAASSQTAAGSKRVSASRFAAQQAASNTQLSSISRAHKVKGPVKSAVKSAVKGPVKSAVKGPVKSTVKGPAKRMPSRLAARHHSVVSVVPASESHALDWTNGSLAHQMDVRPSRTASM